MACLAEGIFVVKTFDPAPRRRSSGNIAWQTAKGRKTKSTKHEQAKDVTLAIDAYVKDTLSRTVKFAQPGNELNRATKMVFDGIKVDLRLGDEEAPEFVRIYASHVSTALSTRRQYAQSWGQASAKGEFLPKVSIWFSLDNTSKFLIHS